MVSEYINENADSFNEEPKKKGFTIGKLFKWICLLLIVLVYVILAARCVQTSDDKIVKEVLVNDKFLAAYESNPENFTVEKYGIEKSWADIREGRLLEFNNLYYVPMASQLQLSVKFNMDLPLCEYDEEIPFKFRLRDENGNEYTDYWYKFKEKMGYGYIRLCFEDIQLEKEEEEIADDTKMQTTDEQSGIGSYGIDGSRKKYTLCVDMVNADGSYSEICSERIYGGSTISREVEFKPEITE